VTSDWKSQRNQKHGWGKVVKNEKGGEKWIPCTFFVIAVVTVYQ